MIAGGKDVVDELIALSVVVGVVFFARLVSKWIRLNSRFPSRPTTMMGRVTMGLKKFQVDDYVMGFTVTLFALTIYAIWLQVLWGNNIVTAEQIVGWTPEQIHQAVQGSKWGIVMEICKVTCVWCCKACLLILYFKLTQGLDNYHRAVVCVSVYVAVGYVVVMVFLLGVWCRPFKNYWRVPDGVTQCATYKHHMIMDAVLNITGDAAMLCLPIPLVIRSSLPLGRKLAVLAVFGLGTMVILCAIANRITNFTSFGSLVYLNWYAGEVSTAVMVANVPHLWPLVSYVFRLGSFGATTKANISGASRPYTLHSHTPRRGNNTATLSEERITFDDDSSQDDKYLGKAHELALEGHDGRTTTKIMAGDWNKSDETKMESTETELRHMDDFDMESGIVRTVNVQQSRHEL